MKLQAILKLLTNNKNKRQKIIKKIIKKLNNKSFQKNSHHIHNHISLKN
jgi:hypothetical protein